MKAFIKTRVEDLTLECCAIKSVSTDLGIRGSQWGGGGGGEEGLTV